MGVPTWRRLGAGWVWMFTRRRSSRRSPTRESGELAVQRMGGATEQVAEFCAALPGPVRVAYEAGPTGFGLARALAGERASTAWSPRPGKIERPAQDRVKTDRRDAERLVRLLMIGGLHAVRVPTPGRGGDARPGPGPRGRARRPDAGPPPRRPSSCCATTCASRATTGPSATSTGWGRVELPEPVAQSVLLDGIGAIDALLVRRESLESQMASLVPGSPWERQVAHLRCLRGIDTLSALGLCAEVGDFERFAAPGPADELPRPGALGEQQRREAPAGRDHQVGLPPRPPPAGRGGLALPPGAAQRPRARAAARRASPRRSARSPGSAQQRLHRSWVRLDAERGKRRTLFAVAVARELAGFCWAVATAD